MCGALATRCDAGPAADATLRIDEHRLFHPLTPFHLAGRCAFALTTENRQLPRMDLFNSRRTSLELRNLRSRIECGIRQLIYRQLFSPVIGNEDRVWTNRSHHQHWKHAFAASRDHAHTFAVVDLQLR